ncbi:hypothetical protein HN695_01865 [Candidatus Woesearchaeota archaeon]|jgi:hypothetical protein|nr:hypothetical protein [Candidatus Woesearchaeota archaeon]MBT5273145.1 hypothetical protein [Candidatus Woesearchaeota archaeon]MBT6041622.1 hypothetical protein [Candidatus Woesearchaeota archaeon]MBT6337540.1 hypothetical protein [Candidatus Woesearchaeota archaeon]MBT7927059.1 hypothetical protein [Candidatus Woesearchaeota archaeon]
MTVVGFNFAKITVEKKGPTKGKVNISNNVTIEDLEESSFSIGQEEQKSLKVIFKFNSTYDPDVGYIELLGDLIFIEEKSRIKEIFETWKEKRRVDKDLMAEILNIILTRCNIQALILARDINLPSPIPLPKVKVETK